MTESQQILIANVISDLLAPEMRHFQKQVDQLIDANDAVNGSLSMGFHYLGVAYCRGGQRIAPQNVLGLHNSLLPVMTKLMVWLRRVEFDKKLIMQMLYTLLAPCTSYQEIRDAFPDTMTMYLGAVCDLPRIQEPAWTIKNNPIAMRQYHKTIEKMEAYAAMRFLY
jgi:hypothetical protein